VIDKATEIHVTLADGRQRSAKVIGRDPKTDLALLKIDGTGLPVIPLGDSSKLAVGAPVMAIGDPFGLEETVTTGIVSATSRVIGAGPYDSFIQTDASINPGNSGGPLINAEGQAIGVNADMFSAGGGSVGIGFAIPIDMAKPVVTQLAETGHVERGWLGVTIQPLTPALAKSFGMPNAEGALVASVMDDSPAQKAGLKRGDVIAEYNGRKVGRSESLPLVVAETPVGRHVPLTVYRDAKRMTVSVTIARLEEPRQERMVRAGSEKPALGLRAESLTLTPAVARQLGLSGNHGVVVEEVQGDGLAANAGIQPGDVIVEVEHHPVASATALGHRVERLAKGHAAPGSRVSRRHEPLRGHRAVVAH
jgi:serine protease Do